MEFDLSNETTKKELANWLSHHLVSKEIGAQITGQTTNSFNQAVKLGYIIPFYGTEGKGPVKVKLYLREELEEYANKKEHIIKRTTHFIESKSFFCIYYNYLNSTYNSFPTPCAIS